MAKAIKCELNKENLIKFNKLIEEGETTQSAIKRLEDDLIEEKRSELLQAVVDRARKTDVQNYIDEYRGKGKSEDVLRNEGWYFTYVGDPSGRFKGQNLFDLTDAMGARYTAPLENFFRAARKTFTKNSKDSISLNDLFKEADGIDSGNQLAKDALKIWKKQTELARNEGNALGTNIGKLSETWFPSSWNGHLMREMGFDKFLKVIEGKVDLERSFPGASPELRLAHIRVWFNQSAGIAEEVDFPRGTTVKQKRGTDRYNRDVARKPYDEDRIFANRWDHVHREIHFKSAVDQWDVMKQLGNFEDDGVTTMIMSLENMARRNATLKLHGTDPLGAFNQRVADGIIDPNFKAKTWLGVFGTTTEGLFKVTTGLDNINAASNARLTIKYQNIKQWILMSKLGKVILTAIPSDLLSSWTRGVLTDTNFLSVMKARFKSLPKEQMARIKHNTELLSESAGSGARQGDAADINTNFTRGSGRLLRAQGLAHWTQAQKDGVAQAISSDLASMAGKTFDELSQGTKWMLESNGIKAKEWDIIRTKGVENFEGADYIFTDRLPVDTQDKLLGLFAREADAHTPTARGIARGVTTKGYTTGTTARGITDLAFQFKGTPFEEYINVAGALRADLPGLTKAEYMAKRIIGGYLTGFVILNLSNLAQGKGFIDPTEMDAKEHALLFIRCITKAGTLGIIGDAVLESSFGDGYGQDLISVMVPPALGILAQAGEKVFDSAISGEPGTYASNLLNFGIDNLPGQNLIGFQVLIDRLIQDNIREILDPKAKQKARRTIKNLKKKDKTKHWWKPGSTTI